MGFRPGVNMERPEAVALAAALAGDHDAFQRLTDPFTREIHVHCYRMLGSFQDAEDGLQETLLRAWRYLASFESRSSFRAWLYRIATNVCLRQRAHRTTAIPPVPEDLVSVGPPTITYAFNLSPYPD